MKLTKKELMNAINQPMCFGSRLVGKKMFAQIIKELCEYKTIEEELGFGLNELIQMLINGIWEVGAVDSETMLPVSQGITHFYIYGIDFENKKIKVFHKVYKEILFDEFDLNKYKQKRLSGWALTKEELL